MKFGQGTIYAGFTVGCFTTSRLAALLRVVRIESISVLAATARRGNATYCEPSLIPTGVDDVFALPCLAFLPRYQVVETYKYVEQSILTIVLLMVQMLLNV